MENINKDVLLSKNQVSRGKYITGFISVMLLLAWWLVFYWGGFLFWEDPELGIRERAAWIAYLTFIPFVLVPLGGLILSIVEIFNIRFRYKLTTKKFLSAVLFYNLIPLVTFGLATAILYIEKANAPPPKHINDLVGILDTQSQNFETINKVFFLPDDIGKEDVVSWDGKVLVYTSAKRTAEILHFYNLIYRDQRFEGAGTGGYDGHHYSVYELPRKDDFICIVVDPKQSLVTVKISDGPLPIFRPCKNE